MTHTDVVDVMLAACLRVFVLMFCFMLAGSIFSVQASERRYVDIWSDGTRISADIWLPDDFTTDGSRPAILMTHGWGGVRQHLNQEYIHQFVQAGFVVLTFDYRGWADSDSRLVILGDQPIADQNGEVVVRARAIREVVDPVDQVRDIYSALDFLSGEPGVDASRIGLWGTSYSGGHVVFVAAQDSRVAAVVSQVGYYGVGMTKERQRLAHQRAVAKARGEIDPIPQGIDTFPNLHGTPDLAKMVSYRPIDWASKISVPILIIDVRDEELFDREKNGHAVFELVRSNVPASYKVFPGRHYDIYTHHRAAALTLGVEWFKKYLCE
jgi:dienelactone hydrolase